MANRYKMSDKKRKAVYDKFNGHCAYCGCKISYRELVVDHFIAFSKNGGDKIDNLFPSCELCNGRKHDFGLEEFRKQIENLPNENFPRLKMLCKYYNIKPKRKGFLFYFETFEKEKENG